MEKKIQLKKEVKEQAIDEVKRYFHEERGEDIGDLAAMLMLDFILENIGPILYNQGIKDAIAFMSEKVEDLYGLEM